jgi:hypothetical protein
MRNFTTPTLRVMRKFTILILLLSGGEIIIDAARLVVGAMLVMLTRLVIVIQIDGKLGRGRKLGRFIVAIPGDWRLVIGRRALLVSVGVRNQSRKFCDGIAFSVGLGTFANHRSCSGSVFAPSAPTHARSINTRGANGDYQSR